MSPCCRSIDVLPQNLEVNFVVLDDTTTGGGGGGFLLPLVAVAAVAVDASVMLFDLLTASRVQPVGLSTQPS